MTEAAFASGGTDESFRKPNKSPRDRFKSVVPTRLANTLAELKKLERCGGRGYQYTASEAQQVIEAVEKHCARVVRAFSEEEVQNHRIRFDD